MRIIKRIIVIAAAVLILIGAVALRFKGKIFTAKDLPIENKILHEVSDLWPAEPLYTVELPPQIEKVIEEKIEEPAIEEASEETAEPIPDEDVDLEQGRYVSLADVITDEERALAALTIYHEARGEPYDGQKAVMEVILNRWLGEKWPDGIRDIVYAPGQFAVADYLLTANLNEPECLAIAFDVVDEVLHSTEYILPEGYVYFATSKVNGKDFIQIGNLYFSK